MARLSLQNVSLSYPVYNVNSRSVRSHLVSFATGGLARQLSPSSAMIDALRGLNLELNDGDSLGLIGSNGAGKSTLLRLLAGVFQPTSGTLTREGRVESLFDLSLGMDMDATGRDNIRLMAVIRGFDVRQAESLAREVEEFSELGDYLDFPVRTYSSGMVARLGFSIATSIQPEILLIDEVLGTGDQYFLQKANQRIRQLTASASILVLTSHSMQMIRQFCNKCALLRRGRIVDFGKVEDVLSNYEKDVGI